MGLRDNLLTTFPFGLPTWDNIIIFASFFNKKLIVGRILSILVVSVILPSFNGTFKSSLSSIFFFFNIEFVFYVSH